LIENFRESSRGFLGEAFDLLWVFVRILWGSIALGLDWSGKIDESFRGLGIFFQWVD
jgi:hypothetical protein